MTGLTIEGIGYEGEEIPLARKVYQEIIRFGEDLFDDEFLEGVGMYVLLTLYEQPEQHLHDENLPEATELGLMLITKRRKTRE